MAKGCFSFPKMQKSRNAASSDLQFRVKPRTENSTEILYSPASKFYHTYQWVTDFRYSRSTRITKMTVPLPSKPMTLITMEQTTFGQFISVFEDSAVKPVETVNKYTTSI